jgi:hypothetical protein
LVLGSLNGKQTNDLTRGQTQNAFFSDPITGKVYWGQGYTGNQIAWYANMTAFINNSASGTITLSQDREGTYHAAMNGYVYYAIFNTNTMARADASTGQVLATASLPNAGYHNQSAFNWGGYSDICFFPDTGGLLYALYATAGGGNMQVSKIDPTSLAVLQTWTINRVKQNAGYAFIVNGRVYIGSSYNSPSINGVYTLATSTYDGGYSNSLTPVSGDYISTMYWDYASKNLLEVSNSHHLIYPNIQ